MSLKTADVEKLYEKDNQLRRDDVRALMEWVEKQPHLPKPTELQVLLMLQSCYYRMEAAKTAIDNYFTLRTLCPELFSPVSKDVIKRSFATMFMGILPETTPEGHTVVVGGLLNSDANKYNFLEQTNISNWMTLAHCMVNGPTKGFVMVIDTKNLTFAHLTRINLAVMKQQSIYVQEGAALRLVSLHYINSSSFVDKFISMIKPLLKKEVFDLIHIYTDDIKGLFQVVPKKIIPKEMGGDSPLTIKELNGKSVELLLSSRELMEFVASQKVDESRRPGKPKNAGEVFGVDGTFKKLEVD